MILVAIIFALVAVLLVWIFTIWLFAYIGKKTFGHIGRNIGMAVPFLAGVLYVVYLIFSNINEYRMVQSYVSQQCKEYGGIKIYISPEEWRKQVGEEEWKTLKPWSGNGNRIEVEDKVFEGTPYHKSGGIFEGKEYGTSAYRINNRVDLYVRYEYHTANYTLKIDNIYFDNKNNNILFKATSFNTGVGLPGIYKGWMNDIKDCGWRDLKDDELEKQYSFNENGE
ncbi:MAG: hypothetical protein Q4G42_03405 [Neisseria sp.]|nr:hypothetical protein [Neisseria sp.]